MKVLVAEDEPTVLKTLQAILSAQGYEVVPVRSGLEAWDRWLLTRDRLIVADWMMPDLDGLGLCRKIRSQPPGPYTYFILQTVRAERKDFLEAMGAGVDDFIRKPVDPDELLARLKVGERILGLRAELMALEGLLAICSYCRRMRDDLGRWIPLEAYVESHSTAQFTHGVCPDCYDKHLKPILDG